MTDIVAEPKTDLIAAVAGNPALVLTDSQAYTGWKAMVEAESAKAGTDVSTSKGRDAIRSAAYKVAQSKTAIDGARKGLTEDYRAKVKAINEVGGRIVEEVAEIAARIRKPLTDWEAAEEAKKVAATDLVERLKAAAVVGLDETAAGAAAKLAEIEATQIDEETYGDFTDAVRGAWDRTTTALSLSIEHLTKAEAERAELEKLRREAAEREERDRAAQTARAAEAAKTAAEEAENARIALAAEQAAEKARHDAQMEIERQRLAAEEVAAAARRALEEAHAAALAAEQEKTAAAERAAREKEEAEEAERQAKAQREADNAHVLAVLRVAKEALIAAAGITEPQARAAVLAIARGQVPAVAITY